MMIRVVWVSVFSALLCHVHAGLRSCTESCWWGTEDCCDVVNVDLYVTCYTPERLAFFNPSTMEYDRFAEGDAFSSFNSQIAFSRAGDIMVTAEDSIEVYDGASGEYMTTLIDIDNSGTGEWYFAPTCIRIGPDRLLYICDAISQRILRYNITVMSHEVNYNHVVLVGKSEPIHDEVTMISFLDPGRRQDPTEVEMYALYLYGAPAFGVEEIYEYGVTFLRANETDIGIINRGSDVYNTRDGYGLQVTSREIRGMAANDKSRLFLVTSLLSDTSNFELKVLDVGQCPPTCMGLYTCDDIDRRNGTTPGVCDFNGVPLEEFGCTCASTCGCSNQSLPYSDDDAIDRTDDYADETECLFGAFGTGCFYEFSSDPFGLFLDKADRLFLIQYTEYTTPLVFNSTSLEFLGKVGTSLGYLATPMNAMLYDGPSSSFSYLEDIVPSVTVGEVLEFTIQLKDVYNNSIEIEDHDFVSDMQVRLLGKVLVGDQVWDVENDVMNNIELLNDGVDTIVRGYLMPTTATLMYEENGTLVYDPALTKNGYAIDDPDVYKFSILAYLSGIFQVPLKGSGQLVFVSPGSLAADKTDASPTIVNAIAGQPAEILITAKDEYKNNRYTGGLVDLFSIDAPPYVNASFIITDHNNGTYTAHITSLASGTFSVSLMFDSKELRSSPLTFVVSAGKLAPSRTMASGDGMYDVTSQNSISIQPNDIYGNHILYSPNTYSSSSLNVTILCSKSIHCADSPSSFHPCDVAYKMVYEKDGTFSLQYSFGSGDDLELNGIEKLLVDLTYDGESINSDQGPAPFYVYKQLVVEPTWMNPTAVIVLDTLAGFMMFGVSIVAFFVHRWRNTPQIRFAQRPFLFLILLGALMVLGSIPFSTYKDKTEATCISGLYMTKIGFTLGFGTMVFKLWRVMKISQARKRLRRVSVTDQDVAKRLGFVMVAVTLYLIVWTLADPIKPEKKTSHKVDLGIEGVSVAYVVKVCSDSDSMWSLVLDWAIALLVLYGLFLGYQTRKVHQAFAEGNWLALAIYNMAVCVGLSRLLDNMFKNSPDYAAILTLENTVPLIGAGGVVLLLFGPKFASVMNSERLSVSDFQKSSFSKSRLDADGVSLPDISRETLDREQSSIEPSRSITSRDLLEGSTTLSPLTSSPPMPPRRATAI